MTTLFCCSSPAATHKRLPALAAPLILHPSVADRSPGLSLIFSGAFNPLPPATTIRRPPLVVKASRKNQNYSSIVCPDCNGNGAILCTQCKGNGVNSVDHFNGQFKAGALCWLCRGKREILCGNCNGAGFVGGFLSTQDD